MNKKLLALCTIIILLITAGLIYLLQKPESSQKPSETGQPQTSNQIDKPSSATAGEYKDYSSEAVASTQGTKIIFFHAPWCPQCRELEMDIKAKGVPAGVTIFKADYDSNQALRQKYGVTLQTTLVKVDDRGNLLKKYVAYSTPSLEAVKNNLL